MRSTGRKYGVRVTCATAGVVRKEIKSGSASRRSTGVCEASRLTLLRAEGEDNRMERWNMF